MRLSQAREPYLHLNSWWPIRPVTHWPVCPTLRKKCLIYRAPRRRLFLPSLHLRLVNVPGRNWPRSVAAQDYGGWRSDAHRGRSCSFAQSLTQTAAAPRRQQTDFATATFPQLSTSLSNCRHSTVHKHVYQQIDNQSLFGPLLPSHFLFDDRHPNNPEHHHHFIAHFKMLLHRRQQSHI